MPSILRSKIGCLPRQMHLEVISYIAEADTIHGTADICSPYERPHIQWGKADIHVAPKPGPKMSGHCIVQHHIWSPHRPNVAQWMLYIQLLGPWSKSTHLPLSLQPLAQSEAQFFHRRHPQRSQLQLLVARTAWQTDIKVNSRDSLSLSFIPFKCKSSKAFVLCK